MQKVVRIGKRIVLSIFAILALLALGAGWVWLSTEQEEVAFQSGDITIRGTLLSPRFGREAPGVVLVHGSGQTSRNSTMLYAWIFASQGYAALAYDKRGVGQSEGGSNEWDEFSVGDLASDAAAGYRYAPAPLPKRKREGRSHPHPHCTACPVPNQSSVTAAAPRTFPPTIPGTIPGTSCLNA